MPRGLLWGLGLIILIAIGAIVYMSTRSKCTLPDTIATITGSDGFPEVPYCESDLGKYIYKNATDVCGDPTTNMPEGTSPLYCDYKNDYTWVYSDPDKPEPTPPDKNCNVTSDGKLPFPISYDNKGTINSYDPVKNFKSYNYISIEEGACKLTECVKGYKPWPDASSDAQYCVPNNAGDIGCDPNNYNQISSSKRTPYPDVNATYTWVYENKDNDTPSCQFKECLYGTNPDGSCQTKQPTTCDMTKYPNAKKVERDSSGNCKITECNSGDGKTFTYKLNNNTCVKTCIQGGDGKKYILVGDNCVANCDDKTTAYIDVFKTSTPKDVFAGFKAKRDGPNNLRMCVPSNQGGVWGNCGNTDNPVWALSSDGKRCEQTTTTDRARFVNPPGSDGNTPGCVKCPPFKCATWADLETYDKYCNASEEKGCGYAQTGVSAVQFCVSENKNKLPSGWKFKDQGDQIGNYMFVNGGKDATQGAPLVSIVPETKFIRHFRVRGTTKYGSDKDVSLEKYTDSGNRVYTYVSREGGGKDVNGITVEKGNYLKCSTTSHPGRSNESVSSTRKLNYNDIEDSACYYYSHDGNIEKQSCPDDAPFYQPPGPTTDKCKMSKCPIEMPPYYYENRNSTDSSLAYKLDNWPDCNGAVNWYMKKNRAKTIGEAYELVLADKNNSC